MKQLPTFRASKLIRLAGTLLTVSLLVTLRVETPCDMSSGAAAIHELMKPDCANPGQQGRRRSAALEVPRIHQAENDDGYEGDRDRCAGSGLRIHND